MLLMVEPLVGLVMLGAPGAAVSMVTLSTAEAGEVVLPSLAFAVIERVPSAKAEAVGTAQM